MIDHLSLGVPDLAAGRVFYDKVMPALGYVRLHDYDHFSGYGRPQQLAVFYLDDTKGDPAVTARGTHIALVAPSEGAVRLFFETALHNGAKSDGEPGMRGCQPAYFGAAIIDPFGHNIELAYRPDGHDAA